MNKIRIDQLLVDRGLAETRSKAAALILAGQVFIKEQRVDKAGVKVADDAPVEVRGESLRYVSRGGFKLEAALEAFGYDCTDKIVLDVGASTGGFTDCVLQRGALEVWAVDVGYGQLAWRLRQDPRVHNIERANIRHLAPDAIPVKCALAVIDCSFISLDKVLPNTLTFLTPDADVIALIKPQFEVGPQSVGKGGVVRDEEARTRAIEAVIMGAEALGLTRVAGIDCPVHGPAGNIEYLVWLKRRAAA
jgi:23S rRNA (cytidine1920-2'-O)/16S rRNA (cytidine1409-2'-O)-methyltransferase